MIQSKRIDVLVACAVVFAVVVSMALVVIGRQQAANGQLRKEPEYAEKVFGADIISVEIIADEDDWQAMLDNALSEQFIMVDVVVNGRRFNNVGIRPKGNSSLMQVASSGSDRYSFRLQLDKYIDGQTCFGLQSFVLNNMLGDFSYMKEYVSYDLMREVGVAHPISVTPRSRSTAKTGACTWLWSCTTTATSSASSAIPRACCTT